MNDDLRPVPRLQLSWAPEFNSPVGLLRWTSSSSYKDALQKPRVIIYPVTVAVLPKLAGCQL